MENNENLNPEKKTEQEGSPNETMPQNVPSQAETPSAGTKIEDLNDLFDLLKKKKRISIPVGIILLILLIIGLVFSGKPKTEKAQPKESLEMNVRITEIIPQSVLYVLEYEHNGIAVEKDEQMNEICYIHYNSEVRYGVEVKNIRLDYDKKANRYTVILPEPTISDYPIDPGSLEYIYTSKDNKSKYAKMHDGGDFKQIQKVCENDVRSEISQNAQLLKMAKENEKKTIEGFLKPFVEKSEGCGLDIRFEGEKK